MNKHTSPIYKKVTAAVLLLFLFCIVANTCPIRSLLTGTTFPTSQTEATSPIKVSHNPKCSASKVSETLILKQQKLNKFNSPDLPVIFYIVGLYLFFSALHSVSPLSNKVRKPFCSEGVPLFLRNQSIII